MTVQSSLSRHIVSDPSPEESEALKGRAWRNYGMLVVNADDKRLDWLDREILRRI
ncbi:MAG: hypothetical protein KGL35_31555 [Bradyrhizobium sp.]|nr:hypothetical protein [Bradyrhizobium sp.]